MPKKRKSRRTARPRRVLSRRPFSKIAIRRHKRRGGAFSTITCKYVVKSTTMIKEFKYVPCCVAKLLLLNEKPKQSCEFAHHTRVSVYISRKQ